MSPISHQGTQTVIKVIPGLMSDSLGHSLTPLQETVYHSPDLNTQSEDEAFQWSMLDQADCHTHNSTGRETDESSTAPHERVVFSSHPKVETRTEFFTPEHSKEIESEIRPHGRAKKPETIEQALHHLSRECPVGKKRTKR